MLSTHVFLVGMAGGGKTSLGRKAAQRLGHPFVDTDERVCAMLGLDIRDIYKTLGEAFFKNAETGVLMSLVGEPPTIVSTGGALPTKPENVQLMQNHGIIIHIDRPLDQILSDIRMEKRPSLSDGYYEDVIQEYKRQIGHYHACADYTLDNSLGFATGLANLVDLIEGLE